jgi:hypothetical protein
MPTPDAATTDQPVEDDRHPLQDRLAVLDELPSRPLSEHAEVYQRLHADLQAALAEIDSA